VRYSMFSILSILAVVGLNTIDFTAKDYYDLQLYAGVIQSNPFAPHLLNDPLENRMDSVVFLIAQHEKSINERALVEIVDATEIDYLSVLESFASEEELTDCLVNESPVVRFYAYKALMDNGMPINQELEAEIVSDSTFINWSFREELVPVFVEEIIEEGGFDKRLTEEKGSI